MIYIYMYNIDIYIYIYLYIHICTLEEPYIYPSGAVYNPKSCHIIAIQRMIYYRCSKTRGEHMPLHDFGENN